MLLDYLRELSNGTIDFRTAFLAFIATAVALLIAITFHEASHALSASRLGDNTARSIGRLSLNPIRHLDPIGTLMLLFVGFGWGKPVPVNPLQLRGNMRLGMAEVSVFGPLANFVVAGVAALVIRLVPWPFSVLGDVWTPIQFLFVIVYLIVLYNLLLGLFNLVPIAPLDGFKVALGILPRDSAIAYSKTERWGPFILLVIIAFDFVTGIGIFSTILLPAVQRLAYLMMGWS